MVRIFANIIVSVVPHNNVNKIPVCFIQNVHDIRMKVFRDKCSNTSLNHCVSSSTSILGNYLLTV